MTKPRPLLLAVVAAFSAAALLVAIPSTSHPKADSRIRSTHHSTPTSNNTASRKAHSDAAGDSTEGTAVTSTAGSGPAPIKPPAEICGNSKQLSGPAYAPSGSVKVPAGADSPGSLEKPDTTYWFANGVHTLGSSSSDQIVPSNGDTYMGAPGAVISGQGVNDFAFTQHATNVKIEYLTVKDFGTTGGNNNEGVVNTDSATGWKIIHSTIEGNAGAGVMLGTNDVVEYDCLTRNGQYGFSSYTPAGPKNITVSHDEISYNDTYNWEKKDPGCGCSGGGKFWDTQGITVTYDYVHDNQDVGIWADTDNVGVDISHNYIADNFSEGVMYEISYDGLIADNAFLHNGVGEGPTNPSFPTGAVYISESGSVPQMSGPYHNSFQITGNMFDDNWSGVILWENANRFCGPDSPDNAGSLCTLDAPSIAKVSTCITPGIDSEPLFSDCRWRTMNVKVTDNSFTFTRAGVGNGCAKSNGCGFNGIFSIYGVTKPYKGWVVPKDISDAQGNEFSDNTYSGPWSFMAVNQGVVVDFEQWTKGFTDTQDGSGIKFQPQDAGSKSSQ